ncbi:MAG: methyltransferase family protein [Planctomycetota bacterium]|jgi:predicted transcriptional regulator
MSMNDASAREALVDMAQGYFRGKTLCAAVRLGIADVLGDGEKRLEEIAAAIGADRDALHRLLRALAAIGIVEAAPRG